MTYSVMHHKMPPSKSIHENPDAKTSHCLRQSITFGESFALRDEERIRRMHDMTPEEAASIIRESGILTASGKLKRGYR